MRTQGKAVIDAMQHLGFYAPYGACQDKFAAMHNGNIYSRNGYIHIRARIPERELFLRPANAAILHKPWVCAAKNSTRVDGLRRTLAASMQDSISGIFSQRHANDQ